MLEGGGSVGPWPYFLGFLWILLPLWCICIHLCYLCSKSMSMMERGGGFSPLKTTFCSHHWKEYGSSLISQQSRYLLKIKFRRIMKALFHGL